MSWTCPSCEQTYQAPCYHPCGMDRGQSKPPKPVKSPLDKVKHPQGRVDLLFARLFQEGVKQSKNPTVHAAYEQMRPYLETALKAKVGPNTRLGRKMAKDLFAIKDTLDRLRRTA